MKRKYYLVAAVLLSSLGIPFARAHHSASMYDFAQTHEVQGVVKDIRVINPHMSLTLVVTDAKGTRPIDFEGHSVNNFYRGGWRPNMILVGDKIKVKFAPRKSGMDGGFVSGFVTAAGREIGFMPPAESETSSAPAGAPSSGK
jgi:hypothetical protein